MSAAPFAQQPFIAIWETTRACALACVHCRAAAMPRRDRGELTTEEGMALLDRIAAFGSPPPLVVFTGGDPLRRPDIAVLVSHGHQRGLVVSLTPSGTAAATEDRLRALGAAGLARLAVSLDAAAAPAHDAFRQVSGSHARTLRIIDRARAYGLALQINTTVCRQDHVGNICPSGFLPMPAGNVRTDDLVATYREHPLFVALRDPARLGRRCGRCEWRDACGGSRARAYATAGDPLGEDPGCPYWPGGRSAA